MIYDDFQIQPMIDNVVNGTIYRVELASIYQKARVVVMGVEELYGRGSVWEAMVGRMSFPVIDPRTPEWQAFFKDTQSYLVQGRWASSYSTDECVDWNSVDNHSYE